MQFIRYLGALTRPFFRWWWALITGVATLLSFFAWRTSGVTLSGLQATVGVCLVLTIAFFALSVVLEGFKWYALSRWQPEVVMCAPADSDSPTEVVHLRSAVSLEPGQVISLLRRFGDRQVCMGMLRVERRIEDRYQCVPVWLAAVHRQHLKQGRIHVAQLSASLFLNETDLRRYVEESAA